MSMIGYLAKVTPSQLQEIVDDPELATDHADAGDASPAVLNLDKSWHLIHYLLARRTWWGTGPLAKAVLGGTPLKGTDAGYGPYRYLGPEEVRETARALQQVAADDLWAKFDAKKVAAAEIYPSEWEGNEEDRQYICQNFDALKQFYAQAAETGSALILHIS